jgi:asparagine synthase (glutamine-hydrolysing)
MGLAKNKGVKVMLDGQGADEMLGGYRFVLSARLASLIRQARWLRGLRFLLQLRRYEDIKLPEIVMKAGSFFLPSQLRGHFGKLIGLKPNPEWLERKWFRKRDVKTVFSEKSKARNILHEQLYHSLMQELLVGLLRYEDRNSMAFSIESRVPFLTPEFANLMYALPEEYIIDAKGTSKAVFRNAMRGIVPSAILERKDKIGFATPEKEWLRHSRHWIKATLGSETAKRAGVFHTNALEREWESFLASRKKGDFGIWRCVNFIRWAEKRNVSFER